MKYWKEYYGHVPDIQGKRKQYDNTIYTFDIETTSFLILNGKQIPAIDYLKLTKEEQEECIFMSNMYIWMFGINDIIYYGRTWEDLYVFLMRIENWATNKKKTIFVHNLSYEFEFLRNRFKMKSVFARKSRKVMKCEIEEFNFEFRCSYMMSNSSLEKLPEIYRLDVKKLVGNLDYSKIRNSKTILSDEELAYCENDCLVVYQYVKKELETYKNIKSLPLTSTGHVRKELKEKIIKDYPYRNKVRRSINTDGHIYNLLIKAFAGGYTHANWIYADEIIKNIDSWDETSAYPYVMVTYKFPATEFRDIKITKFEQLKECFAYLVRIRFKNIKSKYYNNIISQSKCEKIYKGQYDNGRIIGAEEIEIVVTDVDLRLIFETYEFEEYEFLESYYSIYEYLPKQFIEFILEKYVKKTEYKNVDGKEIEYALEKAKFNSLYGMSVTNNIKDEVIFDNINGWTEIPLNNETILKMLEKEKSDAFLSFSYGVWVTAWARYNLLINLIKYDKNVIYADTDSLKLYGDYDINIITEYNKTVENRIKNVAKELEIDINKFIPKDVFGESHMLGIFEHDAHYEEFITQGAKKYAYTKWIPKEKAKKNSNIVDEKDEKVKVIEITVSGVPKRGAKALKKLEDFKDDFVFRFEDTGKNLLIYNDEMEEFELTDYQGNKEILKNKYGCVLVPTTYELGKSEEYADLISDESSKRAIFKEV